MPTLETILLFTGAALVLAVTPGPGLFYVAARTLSGGRAEGIASSLGTGIGGAFHVAAGALGISALVLASAELFTVLKLVGAAYLVFIGWRTFQAARRESAPDFTADAAPPMGVHRAFREGIVVEALNPKTAAFFLAFIPQFVAPAYGSVAQQFIVLGLISVTLNTLADIVVAFAASRIRAGASSRPNLIRKLREGAGAAMALLGIGLAFARRPTV